MLPLMVVASATAQHLVVYPALDPSTGTNTTLPELLSALPASAVGGRWSACAGASTDRSVVAGALARGEGAMRYLELEAASEALNRAAGALGCLGEKVDPTAASRIHYLRGVLAASRGDEGEARRSFQWALAFSPGLVWDEDLAPDAAPLFAEVAAADSPTVTLHLVPHVVGVWIDGRPAGTDWTLPSGEHLVQIDGATFRLEVGDSPVVLLFPDRVEAGAVDEVRDPHLAADLGFLLVAGLGEGVLVDVVAEGEVYRTTTGTGAFTLLDAPVPEPVPSERRHSAWLTWGGVTIGVGGAALAAVSYVQGRDAWRSSTSPPTWAVYDAAVSRRSDAATRLAIGEVVAGAGAVMAGIGVTVTLRPRSEVP